MFNYLKSIFILTLLLGLISMASPAQADWKSTLGELWQDTKAKTVDLKEGLKEVFNPTAPVEVGIAYGTEKKEWLEWATKEFVKTPEGQKIKINLIPIGSVEGAETILKQDEVAKKIHVWSPASSVVQELLVEPWQKEYGKDPILSDAPLVLTPMVIVMWKDRYDAFMQKYTAVNFKTLSEALNEQTGWKAIAAKPEWGVFNFGHTKPTHSNSGLLTLVLMGYDYFDLFRDLKIENIMDEGFLTWLKTTESNMSHEEESTGKLMKDMLTRGPAEFSGIMVYENLALTNLATAEGRWGKIQIVYPTRSVWNDNPFYILDVPWSTSDHRTAAKLFQNFLLSREAQRVARDVYLFRPANLDIPIMDGNTAFDKLKDIVKIDVTAIKRPKAEVLNQLLQVWKKMQ
jgi:ABC-type Fe3+ transport system substrate-binding protein